MKGEKVSKIMNQCPMCLSILIDLGVKRVYYSIWDDEYGVINLRG